jgi:cell division protein FtsW
MAVPFDRARRDLRVFLTIVGLLTLVGLVFIYSSSSVFALEKFGAAHYFLQKQAIYLLLAIVCFFVFAALPLDLLLRLAPYLFLAALAATALTLVPGFGLRVHGSNRWLSIGGLSVQPSEFLKLFLFMYIGFFFEKKQHAITSFFHGYLPFLTILGLSFVVLLKQPDFGSVVTIFATAIVIFFVANFKMVHMLATLALTLPVGIFLIFSKAYRINRILIFLNPWSDPQGRGFQIIQSLIAIGSGQLFGLGISNSKQKFFYLPMQHTDFIFPIIAEETGFIGSCLVILLYFLFCFYGLRLVLRFDRPFAFFTGLGFVVFITLQAVVNLMVVAGLLPTKGLGLPFISYGGTALMGLLAMVGLIANFARNTRATS